MKHLAALALLPFVLGAWPGPAAAIEERPVAMGRALVEHLGCLFCHGLGGREGIVNPNAERKYVPAWDEPEFIERYPTPEKVRDTIREGRFPDKAKDAKGNPIPMPPWGNRLRQEEIDAIIAYIWSLRETPLESHPKGGWGAEAARSADLPPIPVEMEREGEEEHSHAPPVTGGSQQLKRGRSLVEHLGCLHCHGAVGSEGIDNPAAKRKHVPAWDDPEFIRRYQVDDGVRWVIEKGRIPEKDPEAEGNPIPMPPFGRLLSTDEMDSVIAYIWSLREPPAAPDEAGHGPMAGHDH